jgi:HD-GYP domain-containing protein (c-di-GMP phosphodiesterase class II)
VNWRQLSLTQQFALRSLLFVGMMALILGSVLSYAVRGVFERGAAQAVQSFVSVVVVDQATAGGSEAISASELVTVFDDAARVRLQRSDLVAVAVWNGTGQMLKQAPGAGEPDYSALKRALGGSVGALVKPRAGGAAGASSGGAKVLEVYVPVKGKSGSIAGVVEVRQSYAPIQGAVSRLLFIVWGIVIAGSVPSYLLQVTFVNRTQRKLEATEGSLQEVNRRLKGSLDEMEMHSLGTLQALVAAVDAKDAYTARHSIAVTDYAVAIARRLDLSPDEIRDVERAGLLHDIGKIGTPESILLKPDRLDSEEFEVMCEHPSMSGHIVESVPFLSGLMPVVRSHHERWDGRGYPDGLQGEGIPLLARVLTVADAFDAMTSERPYRVPLSMDDARAELLRNTGSQFDAVVVHAMIEALDAHEVNVVIHREARHRKKRGAA